MLFSCCLWLCGAFVLVFEREGKFTLKSYWRTLCFGFSCVRHVAINSGVGVFTLRCKQWNRLLTMLKSRVRKSSFCSTLKHWGVWVANTYRPEKETPFLVGPSLADWQTESDGYLMRLDDVNSIPFIVYNLEPNGCDPSHHHSCEDGMWLSCVILWLPKTSQPFMSCVVNRRACVG